MLLPPHKKPGSLVGRNARVIFAVLAGAVASTLLWAAYGNEYAGFLARRTSAPPSPPSSTVGADGAGHAIPVDSGPVTDTLGPVASTGAGESVDEPAAAVAEPEVADPIPARSDPAPVSTETVPTGAGVIPAPPDPVTVPSPPSDEAVHGTEDRGTVEMSVPPTPLEARVAAEVAMARYTGAVEAADLEALRDAHPWITKEHEATWRAVFARAERITAELWITELSVDDVDARVEIRGICTYTDSRRRTRTDLPMAVTMFLHHDGAEWRPVLASGPDDLPALPLDGFQGPVREPRR